MGKPSSQGAVSSEGTSRGYARFVLQILQRFPERSQAILVDRFGIGGAPEKTLEEIGKRYGITRERVRQIVESVLRNMKRAITERSDDPLIEAIRTKIREHANIISKQALVRELSGDERAERGALTVILYSLPSLKWHKEAKEYEESFSLADFSLAQWKKIHEAVEAVLAEHEDVLELSRLYTKVKSKLGSLALSEKELALLLEPSRRVRANVFGRFGLSHWSSVNPRGTRERAYLVLKTLEKPLHFRDIARLIDEHGLYRPGKKTHPQTVHNELIKDKRFVLVGRGTYALAVWGYQRGTVREVLADILGKTQVPMTKEDLLKAVMKVRQVKKSTVIINLNAFFTKVGKNVYTLKGK